MCAWKDLRHKMLKDKTSLKKRGRFTFIMKLGNELEISDWDLCAHGNGPIRKEKQQRDKVGKKANQH